MTESSAIHLLDLDWRKEDAQNLLQMGLRESPALAQIVPMLERAFLIRSDWAPGGRFMGARMRFRAAGQPDIVINVIGGGLTIERALPSCLGEAIERFSSIEEGHVPLHPMPLSVLLANAPADISRLASALAARNGIGADMVVHCLPAHEGGTGIERLIPAEWCLRAVRSGDRLAESGRPRSLGVAAGKTWEEAALRAAFELIERDAVALWWLGNVSPSGIPLETPGLQRALDTLAALRAGADFRRTWLLDISSEFAIPCIAALSVDRDHGGLCVGTAARASYFDAIQAALFELCQSEIGLAMAQTKLAAGRSDLIADDERHALARASLLRDPDHQLRLMPCLSHRREAAFAGVAASLEEIIHRLNQHNIALYLVNIRKSCCDVPVACAIAPDLQPYPFDQSGFVRSRLGRYLKETTSKATARQPVNIL